MPTKLTEMKEPVNTLYCGDGGTGKTTALASMANLGPVVAVNAEQGIKATALKKHGIDVKNISVFPGPKETLNVEGLTELWLKLREALHKDPDAIAGVFWDPVSEIQQIFVEALAAESVEKAERSGRERSPWVKDQDNWTTTNAQMRDLIRKFRDLPCHFGMSAPLRRMVDEEDSKVSYMPSVSPGLQNDLFGWMDMVCVTSTAEINGEEEFRGLFRPHGKYKGKDRFNVIPKWLVNPTFDRLVAYQEGDIDADSDPVMVEAKERAKAQQATKEKTDTKDTDDKEEE